LKGKKQQATKSESVVDHGAGTILQSGPGAPPATTAYSLAGEVSLADRAGERLALSAAQVDRADVTLAALKDCRVRIAGCPSTLHISNIRQGNNILK